MRPAHGGPTERTRDGAADVGAVTVELALALPAVILVLGLMLGSVGVAQRQVVATSAASTAARVASADADDRAVAAARAVAGESVRVEVTRAGEWVTVTVVLTRPPWPDVITQATAREEGAW